MPNGNLHKFDSKGNLIAESFNVLRATANEFPNGIETDRNFLYVTYGDAVANNISVYVFNKKFLQVRTFAVPDQKQTYGITTDGKALILSKTIAFYDTSDKKGSAIRSNVATTQSYALSFNGTDILAARAGAAFVDIKDTRNFNTKKSIAVGATPLGVCALEDRFIIIPSTSDRMDYYSYQGNLIKSIALPTISGTIVYKDLCQDKDYLWLVSYPSTDVVPPGD